MLNKIKKLTLKETLPYIYVVGGGLGFIASFLLVLERFYILGNPNAELSCNLNPIISCGNVMGTDQASAFGFPNPLLGVAGFAVLITIGMAMIAGAKYKKWFWLGLQTGTILGVLFVHWLIFQSIYSIGSLCPYCMLSWSVVIPIFWYTTLFNLREKRIKAPKQFQGVVKIAQNNANYILFVWILIILGIILEHFWYYWSTLI